MGYTKIFGIFGNPIDHTLSPLMHNAAFEALGLPNIYLPFDVHPDDLRKAVEAIVPLGIQGINVTIPHKEAIIPYLDTIDEEAQKIGAVNTVEVCSNRLIGHNTDGRGFLASLTEMDIDPSGQRVILVGAGGAAKGVSIALLSAGVSELIIMARRSDRGKRLADRLAALFSHVDISVSGMHPEERVFQQKDRPTLLINTTPLGMKGDDPIPFTPSLIESEWIVADLVYRPAETPLLSAARNIGAKRVPGHGMLLHQGALAFEIWTNEKAPLAVMKNALWNALSSQGSS